MARRACHLSDAIQNKCNFRAFILQYLLFLAANLCYNTQVISEAVQLYETDCQI